ncbi:hypothetical protein ACFLXV_02990 [Chloroflexota bacterium]
MAGIAGYMAYIWLLVNDVFERVFHLTVGRLTSRASTQVKARSQG